MNNAPPVGQALPHESAALHVSGQAIFIDDIALPENTLHAAIGYSARAHARIRRINLDRVLQAPDVVCVTTANDVLGNLDIAPVSSGDPLFAADTVECVGQPIFAAAAKNMEAARAAIRLAQIEYDDLPAILTIEEALAKRSFIIPSRQFHVMQRGTPDQAIAAATHRLQGDVYVGAQEHFSLEGHIACAIPMEEGGMHIISSTQNPTEIQHAAAQVLNCDMRNIVVETRRMGGAFGGKETQAAHPACIAALLAARCNCPVKLRMARYDDFVITGKRHPFWNFYDVGFNKKGVIAGVKIALAADCGMSADLSLAIIDRAMFHADNAYYYPHARIIGLPCKTHTPSNTAFRGFGGPQGMMLAESMITSIARFLGKDPLEIRRINLYRNRRQLTPYHQAVSDNIIPPIVRQLALSADYKNRRREIRLFNRNHKHYKKGLALTPVKFGISFTTCFLNQAAALIHIYHDGSVHLNHGGTEMGQGLFIKTRQIVAEALGILPSRIQCSATRTDKSPNTSATAASAGADLNGMAAYNAALKLRRRLINFAAGHYQTNAATIIFINDVVHVGNNLVIPFAKLAKQAYLARVPLSATGFYKTPKIHYDRKKAGGRPFFYYCYGAAACEVIIDCLTGEHQLLRADILHDVGRSINPAVDMGQVEGGFIQGLGWLTCEEIVRDEHGRLLTNGPATYKIPAAGNTPDDFRVAFYKNDNKEKTIYHSKAVGEPPLMLAMSAYAALEDATRACGTGSFSFDAPLTPERILKAIENAKQSGRFKSPPVTKTTQSALRVARQWMNRNKQ